MRPVLAFALALVSMAVLCSAVSMEEKTLNFSVSEVPGLVTVSTNLDTTNLLPGFEYNYTLTVRWAVPNESLRAITADEVMLFVKVRPMENNTSIYFRNDGEIANARYITLRCVVADGACSNESVLVKGTRVYYVLQPDANISLEQLSVSASLVPFADNATIAEVYSLTDALSSRSLNDDLRVRFETARQMAENGDYDYALIEFRAIDAASKPAPVATPTPAASGGDDNWKLLAGALVVLLALLAALYFTKGKKPKKGFEGLEDHDIRGRGYDDSPQGPLENIDYKAPEPEKKPDEAPVVQRVPDWFG